jgi:transcriptional regulator with XRE-family HTH domain
VPRPLRELTPALSPAHRLGAELRAFRLKAGHTQKSLGEEINVSKSLIGSIEIGDRIGSADVIASCDEALDAGGALLPLWQAAAVARRAIGRPANSDPQRRSSEDPRCASPLERALVHIERTLTVRLDRARLKPLRASVGVRTDRGTWIRLEGCAAGQAAWRTWSGPEAVVSLDEVAAPAWFNGLTWKDDTTGVLWRADEMALVEHPPVSTGQVLRSDPRLPESWWRMWNTSLDALARHECARIAVVDGQPLTESRITRAIGSMWPSVAHTSIDEWSSAHGAMTWANLTGPACWIIDWQCWGRAPRGLDAATLWSCSLAVPQLAARIWAERRTELESPTGTVMALYSLARILTDPAYPAGPLAAPARHEAARLLGTTTPVAA